MGQTASSAFAPQAMTMCLRGLALLTVALSGGCAQSPQARPRPAADPSGLAPHRLDQVDANVAPPVGWKSKTAGDARHDHVFWLSPSGSTAYGVIMIRLPLPLRPDAVLWAALQEMRRREGEARLLAKIVDPLLPGLRVTMEGGRFHMRSLVVAQGWRAWVIYAGTLRERPESLDELDMAVKARESTIVGPSSQPAGR